MSVNSFKDVHFELSQLPNTGSPLIPLNNTNYPKICLNMIVKNESRVIERLLGSVYQFIDAYLICDTGSTDNTKQIITDFFSKHGIPGQIIEEPFRDFGYNRAYALAKCAEMVPDADYALLMDADMVLTGSALVDPVIFKRTLTKDYYRVLQGSISFQVENTRLVKNNGKFSYWGVTHEYVTAPDKSSSENIPEQLLFINDIGDGGAKSDKFERDIRLLERGLQELPRNDRYTFYLANSLKDAGNSSGNTEYIERAIQRYKERIEIGGWIEETWQCYYKIGDCYETLKKPADALYWYLEGHQKYPARVENLYKIVQHYRVLGKNEISYAFCVLAKKMLEMHNKPPYNQNYLFFERSIYDYKVDYELSIIGYYVNYYKYDLKAVCMKVLRVEKDEDWVDSNVMSNYKFYTDRSSKYNLLPESDMEFFKYLGTDIQFSEEFVKSTPSIIRTNSKTNEYLVCLRYVNYRIDDRGNYVNREHITTHNVLYKCSYNQNQHNNQGWSTQCFGVLEYNRDHDGHYVGLEDVRLFYNECTDQVFYCANRGVDGKMFVEYGVIVEQRNGNGEFVGFVTSDSVLLKTAYPEQRNIEKNWVLLPDGPKQKMVYQWYPLTIGEINEENRFVELYSHNTPNFFKNLRGSTNGVLVNGNELWFITHTVSYEDRRYYYHMWTVLDAKTYKLKRYSPFFTFEKERVEYTLGFVYRADSSDFLVGYSVLDRETKWISLSKSQIETQMIMFA